MTMIEGPTGFILFHNATTIAADGADTDPNSLVNGESLEYLRGREHAERAAAKRATSTAARRAHQELAQSYARQVTKIGNGS